MDGMNNSKNHSTDISFPGCLGRMVNLFDLNAGVAANRQLTNKPHRDVSPLSRRSQSDVSNQFEDQLQDKVMVSEFSRTCSNKKACGTPMKMLIAQEMSKEVNSKHNPPSLVAKLMGLDALPQQQPDLAKQRSLSRIYSRSQSDTLLSYWQHDKGFWDLQMHHGFHQYPLHNECKDIYEIVQQSPKTNSVKEKPSPKGRCDETANDRKMALVRQKFMEAKRLSTDEKLRQTQRFQDALEVLNSNKDFLLKFLQEPNSMFSQHSYNSNAVPPPETKRITVLRPRNIVDNGKFSVKNNEKQIKKDAHVSKVMQPDKSNPVLSPTTVSWKVNENPAQPTRIVVLKPNLGKPHDIKAVVSPPSLSSGVLHGGEFIMEAEDEETRKSREIAKEITRQMRENLSGHRRDETLLSSVFSNGYIGDESSFHNSENEYAAGNLSDSEVMSPTSRHSWDYVNKYGSPFSSSSFSRASYSPESSVCREAKKRLSERWAMMASNGNYKEQRSMRRNSSTLGEMLALSDTKNASRNAEGSWKEDSRGSTTNLVNDMQKDEVVDDSMRNLVRSKSVPESSTFGIQPQCEAPDEEQKAEVPKETAKARRAKSSFKGKVSSLFFSRSKRSNKEKPITSESQNELLPVGMPSDSPGRTEDDRMKSVNDVGLEECSLPSPSLHQISSTSSDPAFAPCITTSSEACFSVPKHLISGNRRENQDQPSPVSVLETPFEDDEYTATESSTNSKPEEHGNLLVNYKSNLIDKSPPIGSIARSLSWGDSCGDTATSCRPSFSPKGAEEEEREWFFFVQALLSVAGLEGEVQSDTFLARWHSSENPLEPSLRDKFINLNDMDWSHEAKRRQKRSTGKLVFDCVNAALVDIAGYGSDTCQRAIPSVGPHNTLLELEGTSFKIVDKVWARMKEWLSGEERCVLVGDCGDDSSPVVEKVVRKEVVGKGWLDHLRLEMDNLGNEIEGMLLEELVQEAVVELTCCRS